MADDSSQNSAPSDVCRRPDDYFGVESRRTMVRLASDPLSSRFLTPLEFLHSEFHQRIIYENGELLGPFQSAALAQAKVTGDTPQKRQKDLVALFDKVVARTRTYTRRANKLGLTARDLSSLKTELGNRADDKIRSFVVYSFLAKKLDKCTAWLTKLHKLESLYAPELDDKAVTYLDEILAEVLLSRTAINELLGKNPGLQKAVPLLVALHDGKLHLQENRAAGPAGADVVTREGILRKVSALLASDRFPISQGALADVIARIMAIPKPYRSNERDSELLALVEAHKMFGAASERLRKSSAWHAFTTRVGRAISEASLDQFVKMQRRPGVRLRQFLFFRRFCETDHQKALLEMQIERVFRDKDLYDELMREGRTLVDKLKLFGFIYRQINDTPMDAFRKLSTIADISSMQARFIEEQNFFDSLTWVYHDVVERALTLVDLLRDGMFVEGPAQNVARKTIRTLIASDVFQKEYLKETRTEAEAAQKLGTLKERLLQAKLMQ